MKEILYATKSLIKYFKLLIQEFTQHKAQSFLISLQHKLQDWVLKKNEFQRNLLICFAIWITLPHKSISSYYLVLPLCQSKFRAIPLRFLDFFSENTDIANDA